MKITKEEWDLLSYEEKSRVARQLSQKEWDKLFPPKPSDREPRDASGFTNDLEINLIG